MVRGSSTGGDGKSVGLGARARALADAHERVGPTESRDRYPARGQLGHSDIALLEGLDK